MMMSCDLHDYIEIACLYQLPLELHLRNGSVVSGVAKDTAWNEQKQECIQVILGNGEQQQLVLTELESMRATKANPHIDVVHF